MCGIFALLNSHGINNMVRYKNNFMKGSARGPENSVMKFVNHNLLFGFHRLAINGYKNENSKQPITVGGCVLICNGEIYNWKKIYSALDITPLTSSDCEVIIHLYKRYGIQHTLNVLDGVFAFVLYDMTTQDTFIARDPYGVRPLFMLLNKSLDVGISCVVASEIKMLGGFINLLSPIKQFQPGSYMHFNFINLKENKYLYHCMSPAINPVMKDSQYMYKTIRDSLISAVKKRTSNTDRNIACLLSGGLDSSLITSLVSRIHGPQNVNTWSIGLKGSTDLKCAKIVADYLGTKHHSIELEVDEFLNAIEPVIKAIESYDITTIRASVGNWLICKYIKEQSDAKVVFNGDGSDEVTGGYMYFHCAPDEVAFDKECKRLLKDIAYFDVLRSDRTISAHGLEARTPFLDKAFVQTYLSIPESIRFHAKHKQCEKFLLRQAFDELNVLPKEILWRTKEAFSDGVSTQSKAWYEIIQEHAASIYAKEGEIISPKIAESRLYRRIFNKYYEEFGNVIPYTWMPKFVDATDASARTLDIYKSVNNANNVKI